MQAGCIGDEKEDSALPVAYRFLTPGPKFEPNEFRHIGGQALSERFVVVGYVAV